MGIKKEKIAFIGTGFMGVPMARRLLEAGYPLMVYNRRESKTAPLRAAGAKVAKSPWEAVEQCDVIIEMLSHYAAIEDVFFREMPDAGAGIWKGKTLLQMSTISADESLLIKDKMESAGGEYVEAPVLGGVAKAEAGQLLILVGGSKRQAEKWDALLSHLGENRYFIGDAGKAASIKLALNQMGVAQTAALSMSQGYLAEAGVDVELFMQILRKSAFYSPGLERKTELFRNRDFSKVGYPMKLMLKDIDLMVDQFKKAGIDTAPLEGMQKIVQKGIDNGHGEADGLSVYNFIHPA